ncbi:hypothetical protein CVT25_014224 [Psilocybe cyanescens]|uniref:Uncharacterized protein n=1 Tax=Psilocybe cyanescens TaxID=93625 RepID=A0A409XL39_PSICY|nr:hypothetical protein CVT25_014224 [Psilocybe cyanescens]
MKRTHSQLQTSQGVNKPASSSRMPPPQSSLIVTQGNMLKLNWIFIKPDRKVKTLWRYDTNIHDEGLPDSVKEQIDENKRRRWQLCTSPFVYVNVGCYVGSWYEMSRTDLTSTRLDDAGSLTVLAFAEDISRCIIIGRDRISTTIQLLSTKAATGDKDDEDGETANVLTFYVSEGRVADFVLRSRCFSLIDDHGGVSHINEYKYSFQPLVPGRHEPMVVFPFGAPTTSLLDVAGADDNRWLSLFCAYTERQSINPSRTLVLDHGVLPLARQQRQQLMGSYRHPTSYLGEFDTYVETPQFRYVPHLLPLLILCSSTKDT